jgi:hypothetical protein
MKKITPIKMLACVSVAVLVAGQALAHTGVRDVAVEGLASYNGFTITHGCAAVGEGATTPPKPGEEQQYPVIGQVALFPYGKYAVWKDASGNVIAPVTGEDGKVRNNGNGTIKEDSLSLSVTGYDAYSSPFTSSQEIVDANGNVMALLWKDGAMEPKKNAITPFKITAPNIVQNCTRLKVRIGVINYCDKAKNEANDAKGPFKQPKDAFGHAIPMLSLDGDVQKNARGAKMFGDLNSGNGDNNRADWWFTAPNGGSKLYKDKDVLQPTYWTTLNIIGKPDEVIFCPVDSDGNTIFTDVTVEPNGAAFDTFLSVGNTQPFTIAPQGGKGL